MSFAGKGQELPRAEPVGDVVCGRRARIAPRRACRGCRLREKGKNCPAQSLSGMSFAGEGQELPRAEPVGDVVCGRRARIAPRRACRGCRLREKGKNCPARDLAGMSFAGEGQELSRAVLVGDVICEKGVRIAPLGACRGCRLREKGKNCPAYSLAGMSFVRRKQESSRSELAGDVVCGRRTIIAPGET